ncbi:toprim domain-containing protein [Priestia megaterium]|uniref:toprim domain-containing protein n=1 Tax=Priestia megaterium TaxID=1404 RepID=UPI000BFD3AFE|nr:toprim domain-containing protein [Priestia megaterium]PGO60569.1 DNA topoisomerase [Priestia megaterium]
MTVLTYSSQYVNYEVARPNGKVYSLSYEKGDNTLPLTEIGKSDQTYTKITYELDDDVYEENEFTLEELCEIASQQASLINGQVIVIDEQQEIKKVYKYEGGINQFLEENTESLEAVNDLISFTKTLSCEAKQEGKDVVDNIQASFALKYTKQDDGLTQIEFLNGSNLIHHGTIYDGLVAGLRTVINKYLKDNGLYKKDEKQISKEDVLVGLNYVVNFKSYFPVFASQTKFASYVKYYEPTMKKMIEEFFESYVIENKTDMERIAKQVLINKQSREKAEKTRLDVKKKLQGTVNNISNRVDGFVNCKSKDKTKTEMYVVEGKSALGSTKQGRDADIQAIYAIRGKILNCLKADYDVIFKNDVIVDLIKLFGCGIEVKSKHNKELHTFNPDNLRWSKIIFTTDADYDGFHIRTLLLAMIYRLMPSLFEMGVIYIAESPLYEIENNGTSTFAYSDSEMQELVAKMKGAVNIQRSKGLGENTAEMMWDTTMNPESRRLIQVLPEDMDKMKETFDLFLGNDLEGRKKYIEENLHLYIEESLD